MQSKAYQKKKKIIPNGQTCIASSEETELNATKMLPTIIKLIRSHMTIIKVFKTFYRQKNIAMAKTPKFCMNSAFHILQMKNIKNV
jgi:hypothetical protein